jgi:hypothetical protein
MALEELNPQQRKIARRAYRRARKRKASPKVIKALFEALGVEANFSDPGHGDRDSEGGLQQRPSQGWGPASETLEQDIDQFIDRAMKIKDRYGSAGELAQAVQRSAFPARYDERGKQAEGIIKGLGGYRGGRRVASATTSGHDAVRAELGLETSIDPKAKTAVVLDFLEHRDGRRLAMDVKSLEAAAPAEVAAPADEPVREPKEKRAPTLSGSSPRDLAKPARSFASKMGFNVSDVRSPEQNAAVGGAKDSDHLPGKDRWAEDYSDGTVVESEKKLKLAQKIARHYGVRFVKNSYESGGEVRIGRRVYRLQILYGEGIGHADHVHVGWRRVR